VRYLVIVFGYAAVVLVVISAYQGRVPFDLGGRSAGGGLCGTALAPGDYAWPVKPFDEQHPIRGGFGDPRTLTTMAFGTDAAGGPGSFSFHNGVDIAAPPGTRVYPVVSGWATIVSGDQVRVLSGKRIFRYQHIRPLIGHAKRVDAGVTVLGTVKRGFDHVHLTEIDGTRVVDPLLHLRPYHDRTTPKVLHVFFAGAAGGVVSPSALTRRVVVTAQIDDAQPIRVPGIWGGYPLAPAYVGAAILDADGAVVWRRIVADFRLTEPPQQDFWDVYARGTFQNFPVFGHRYYFGQPGRYVFRITRDPLDVRRFADGDYTLRITAADLCGNASTTTRPLRFAGQVPES